jgi:DNA polymerase-3 subunit alpha
MPSADFVHLHTHTEYSLLDGANRISDLVKAALRFKMPALAMTDHGNLFGAVDFYRQCANAGIKPIIGCELYLAPRSRFDKKGPAGGHEGENHLILLARDEEGYRNLIVLSTLGYTEGFYYRPRIDKELLAQHSRGLLCMSACLNGEVAQLLLKDRREEARRAAGEFRDLFGEHYYLEIQDHGIPEEGKVAREMIALSGETGIPLVATNDCHYLAPEDVKAHEALLCIQTNSTMQDPNRFRFTTDQVFFKSPQEMKALFEGVPGALGNTLEIAERCNLRMEVDTGKLHLPHFPLPKDEESPAAYLEKLARIGLAKRYPEVTPEIEARLASELKMIVQMRYAGYFLIVRDFVDAAKARDIPVGPGRGSAAGSLVSYALGITDVDPLEYGLFFERFLNPERVDPPDIDIDFGDEKRPEIIRYVKEKYGQDNVSPVITFGTMQARAAIRDVGRVMGISYSEMDRLAKMIPFGEDLAAAEKIPEVAAELEGSPPMKEVFTIARRLEGIARHASTHAAGIVITPGKLTDYVPLFRTSNDEVTTQYEMKCLSAIGVMKMDFLGLRTLTVIDKTLKTLARDGHVIELNKLPLDDAKTYALLARADTIGVFQLESTGMRDLLRRLKPLNMKDIIAAISLYRPGPMAMIDEFIERRNGRKPIHYDHPVLESVLEETYGIGIYQEQVMEMATRLAGFTPGKADLLRRAMGKKKPEVMEAQKGEFISKARLNKISEKLSEKIFNQIAQFAGYGFNKSHAAGYAMLAYQTAYLKAHYPAQFMAANLTSEMGNTNRIVVLINECKTMRLKVLPPDVNASEYDFVVIPEGIRFGLGAIKNVGQGAIESILAARRKKERFSSIFELASESDSRLVNKKVLESLARSGALDSLGVHRAEVLATLEEAVETAQDIGRKRLEGQFTLFVGEARLPEKPRSQAAPLAPQEILSGEKEMLGFYLSGHPLERYRDDLLALKVRTTGQLEDMKDNAAVLLGGIVATTKRKMDKRGRMMHFITLEDFEGAIEVTVFADLGETCPGLLAADKMILVRGRVSTKEGEKPKVIAQDITDLAYARADLISKVHLSPQNELTEKEIENLKTAFARFPGKASVFFHLNGKSRVPVTVHAKAMRVEPRDELLMEVRAMLGEESVKLEGEWKSAPPKPRNSGYGNRNGW